MRKVITVINLKTYIFKDPKTLLRVTAWRPGVTPDWGYVFDRNQDGRVDYIAYMEGPRAVAPSGETEELPILTGKKFTLTGNQIVFLASNQPLGFWHVADDNYDGKIDGFAMRANAVINGWSYGWMVVESTGFNDKFDKCTYYSEHDKSETYSCESINEGHEYIVQGKFKSRSMPIEMYNKWMSMANDAASGCKLDAKNFYEKPGTFAVSEKVKQPSEDIDDDLFE
jgi:hypothetical protein